MQRYTVWQTTLKRALAYADGWAGLRADDVIFTSFPRSGNTWIRFVLCNYLSLAEMDGVSVDFHLLDATMPALGFSRLTRRWPFVSLPRFVKTHCPYTVWLFSRPRRVVYVLRDPRDVMVSYYHFARANRAMTTVEDFSTFIRHERYGLEAFLHHFVSWQAHITTLVRYEALRQDPTVALNEMFVSLGVSIDTAMLAEAVERASLNSIRSAQADSGISGRARFDHGFQFARKGHAGQWLEYFSANDLVYYRLLATRYAFNAYPVDLPI